MTKVKPPTPEALKAELSRRHLLDFTLHTFPEYKAGWFHRRLAEILETVLAEITAGKAPRIILTAPPQHGKSELVSRRLPAFALGRNPDLRIIATSYSADRALDFSNDVQHIMDAAIYNRIFPESRLTGQFAKLGEAKRTASFFQVVGKRGRYRAAGIGGGITGEAADLLLVDDPLKDFAEAISETTRDATWEWLTSVALTRLSEGGGAIIMATRWHMDDPIGRLIERQPAKWQVYNFRAVAEADEPPYRIMGEALAPELHSIEALTEIRDGGAMSAYGWEALYQQRPSPLGGGIFKRENWQFYTDLPKNFPEMIQSWDMAFKDTRSSDFVVGQVWGIAGAGRFLCDQVRGHFSFTKTLEMVRQLSAKWPKAVRKLVEDKANGTAVIDSLKNEIPGFIAVNPEGGKEARAHAVSAFVEAHNCYLPDPVRTRWANAFIEEAAQFPAGAHDDQVDAMTQALNYLARKTVRLGLVELILGEEAEREAEAKAAEEIILNGKPCTCPPACTNRRGMMFVCSQCNAHWPAETAQPAAPEAERHSPFARNALQNPRATRPA